MKMHVFDREIHVCNRNVTISRCIQNIVQFEFFMQYFLKKIVIAKLLYSLAIFR